MIVRHIIEDLESVFESLPESKEFDLAFASYLEDDSGKIEFRTIEAFHWDDDEEFFLVPSGCAKYYSLDPVQFKAADFLTALKNKINTEIEEYCAYARARIKIAKDGSTVSLNSPLWGTGYHENERLLYFYHGKQPNNAT
ncbi:hypothetical protein [Paraglaciecola hydrolytica]|uniref:Uncharacterized protein n=1 Tax=Paraglaciecola hydrolytica TaxID=1799789 RepID=A0A136A6J8_9ALTE|nr:hypothetical protein [Paraglaciecola hydrolytica]KXI30859.1 hypothetical protein AX660_05505 [Paraglaciecola hydrolytica]